MSNIVINDGFMNPDRFGYTAIPFKLDGDRLPREDIKLWRIRRSDARSMGKATFEHTKRCECGSVQRRVHDNTCYPCFKLSKNK